MAKIWFCRSGKNPTHGINQGQSITELPWEDAQKKLKIRLGNWCGEQPPKFQINRNYSEFRGSDEELAAIRDPEHVVVEVDEQEIKNKKGWRAGFYRSPLSVSEARKRLGLDSK